MPLPMHLLRTTAISLISLSLLAACELEGGKSLSGEPPVVAEWMTKGEGLEKQGDTNAAMGAYERAMNASKETVAPHLALARLLREQKKASQALPLLEKARQRAPQNADVIAELGFAHIAKGEQSKALGFFDEALTLDKSSANAFSGKGVALDLMGEHETAQGVYREAINAGVESPALTNNYALSLILSGNSKDAVGLLEPLVKSGGATSTMRQNLALAYGLRGNTSKSMEYGLKDLSPEQARENLAFYKRIGELKSTTKATVANTKEKTNQAVPVDHIDAKDTGFDTTTKTESKPVELKKAETPKPAPAAEIKKEEAKPVAKTEAKKEEVKPTAKAEPKKEEAKPAAKIEPKKEEPKAAAKKEEVAPVAKTEPAKPVATSAAPQAKPGLTPHPSSVARVKEESADEVASEEPNAMEDGNYLPETADPAALKPAAGSNDRSILDKIVDWEPDSRQ